MDLFHYWITTYLLSLKKLSSRACKFSFILLFNNQTNDKRRGEYKFAKIAHLRTSLFVFTLFSVMNRWQQLSTRTFTIVAIKVKEQDCCDIPAADNSGN
ncbi:predicted protein [Escherichia albertii]|nr:predicted protein [Escherichia albertii]BAT39680.1 predicted protein [Escherichia albertii]